MTKKILLLVMTGLMSGKNFLPLKKLPKVICESL